MFVKIGIISGCKKMKMRPIHNNRYQHHISWEQVFQTVNGIYDTTITLGRIEQRETSEHHGTAAVERREKNSGICNPVLE